jgi:hypothetical protein
MTEGDPTDRLSAKRQFVVVLRFIVEVGGDVIGELVDPLSQRRERFMGRASLASALQAWIDDFVSGTRTEPDSQLNRDI